MTCIMLVCAGCGADPSADPASDDPSASAAGSELEAEPPEGLLLVIDAGGPLVVLERDPDPIWGRGAITLEQPSHPTPWLVTGRAIEPLRVPAELASLSGASVVLHGDQGELCRAELGELVLVRRSDPEELHDEESPPTNADELGERAWRAVASSVVLGSRPRASSGDCTGAAYATLPDGPEPERFAAQPDGALDPALSNEALLAFRSLASHAEIQTSYDLDLPVLAPHEPRAAIWDQHDGAAPWIEAWSSGERTLIAVRAQIAEPPSCELGASLWALFSPGRDGLELVADSSVEAFPSLLFDADHDGRLELLAGERLLIPTADGVAAFDVDVPGYRCGC